MSPGIEANRLGGVRVQGEILGVHCGKAGQVAACRVEGRRVLVDLTGASIFANGESSNCDALVPDRRLAAYGPVISCPALALEACLFAQRAPEDAVAEDCGTIMLIRATEGLVVASAPCRGPTEVQTDPGLTRFIVQGERATIYDLALRLRACAVGLLTTAEPDPVMRPTARIQARIPR